MQKTALITQLGQTHSSLWRLAKSQLPFPPGIVLHGDEWELILGIEMLFPRGLQGAAKASGRCLKCMVLEKRPEAASENTQLSPETFGGRKPFSSGSSRSARGSWGPNQGQNSSSSCPRHCSFFRANEPCCLGNSKSS